MSKWAVVYNGKVRIDRLAKDDENFDPTTIANMVIDDSIEGSIQDALKMAAAPEMYAALLSAKAIMEQLYNQGVPVHLELREIERALAKATDNNEVIYSCREESA